MKRRNLWLIGVLAAFFAASIFTTACGGLNDPKKAKPEEGTTLPEEKKPEALQQLTLEQLTKTSDGKTYDQYKIEWTNAEGVKQEKVITIDKVKEGLILPGGITAGTTVKITPQVKNSEGKYEDKPDAAKEEKPSTSTGWKLYIKAGIDELDSPKPDYDAALAHFRDAYGAEQNNTTKAYYAAVQLATISVKQETVDFMRNRMGFATYPEKLNALANLEWFKEQTYKARGSTGVWTSSFSEGPHGNYFRVSGHIASSPDATKVSIQLSDNREIYEQGTFAGLNGKWVELGYNEAWKKIDTMPIAERKPYYNFGYRDQLPHTGDYFIVDSFDENGNYLVWNSGNIDSMQGAATAKQYNRVNGEHVSYSYDAQGSFYAPELKPAADWYKDFDPLPQNSAYILPQIPAYIIEHSDSANVDQLIDELYGILFGKEFTNASNLLDSLDASQPVTIDKKLISVLHMDDHIFNAGANVELQKDQLLGLIGGLTITKGAFELAQSYSFNTDLSILKWNWFGKDDEILKNLGSYNQKQDPFNNGFLKGRSQQKIIDAKADVVKGADLLLAAYKSLTDSATLPAKAKDTLKKETSYIQAMLKEIRDAVANGKKANILIGENNPLAARPAPQPGMPVPTYMTTCKIDMRKVFTYEYFNLSNLFEMDGAKPKIYPADSSPDSFPYMNLTLKRFMTDFVTIQLSNGREVFEDGNIPLNNDAGKKIINFYK